MLSHDMELQESYAVPPRSGGPSPLKLIDFFPNALTEQTVSHEYNRPPLWYFLSCIEQNFNAAVGGEASLEKQNKLIVRNTSSTA